MKTKISLIGSALVGITFGLLGNYSVLKSSWFNLVVWAVVGILIGMFIEEKRFIKWSGISYGFFLVLSFLVSGFQGKSDKIISFGIFTVILSIIGSFCGWVLVFLGNWIKGKFV
jgi:hypothetical protein